MMDRECAQFIQKGILMRFVFFNSRSLRALCLAAGLAMLALQDAASAGVLSYNSGSGGTFDPSSPSTFTFTNFGVGSLSPGVDYTDAKVLMRWGGTTPYPGAFDITGVSMSTPSAALGNVQFLAGTTSGSLRGNSFVALSSVLNTTNLSGLTLTLTIPTLTLADGFFLEVAVQGTDNGLNTNATAFQRVTAFNSTAAVPEPSVGILAGCVASAIWYARRRRSMTA
jgi:hypothetical protein